MTDTPNTNSEDLHRLVDTAKDLADRVVGLQEQLQEKLGIAKAVSGLETRADKLQKLQGQQRKWGRVVVVGLILDLALTCGLSGMFIKVNHNSNAVAKVQNVVSKEVLCPVYGLVLSAGYHPERHKDDLAAYKNAYAVFVDGNKKLNCPGAQVAK